MQGCCPCIVRQYSLIAPARRANIKVSSTETGAIFGNLVYEATGYADRSVVVLNDIHIDIMDYISPAYCADVQFRAMWAEFEWENKVLDDIWRMLHLVAVWNHCEEAQAGPSNKAGLRGNP
jgi:hypothetical protein